ncbi:hypothetical protein NDU88_002387 [Pleurodeles waltl]|uniref:Uncharacterized protein n=1 Tax=Pleurodeles waltl TaxID=8319 RepID=A0AAV7KVZ6_PLEWA|nr:hypothetical protein NDU88_002387 [Pleurodeles waltl]
MEPIRLVCTTPTTHSATSRRSQMVDLAPQAHQGRTKTKALRRKVWFSGMDRICGTHLSLDFGSYPGGTSTVVIIEDHSEYLVVEVMHSTAFKVVRPMMEKL